jgi:hypothetical protein
VVIVKLDWTNRYRVTITIKEEKLYKEAAPGPG